MKFLEEDGNGGYRETELTPLKDTITYALKDNHVVEIRFFRQTGAKHSEIFFQENGSALKSCLNVSADKKDEFDLVPKELRLWAKMSQITLVDHEAFEKFENPHRSL